MTLPGAWLLRHDEAMAYGHAERTLAAIRLLEAETRDLLSRQEHLEPEHVEWLRTVAESASRRLGTTRLVSGIQERGTTARSV
jgi:hypothetical protein